MARSIRDELGDSRRPLRFIGADGQPFQTEGLVHVTLKDEPKEKPPEPSKPPKPPKKTWREKMADLSNGIGDALGEALFGGGR